MNGTIQTRVERGSGGELPPLAAAWQECLAACPPEQGLFTYAWYADWVHAYGMRAPWTGNTTVVTAHDDAGRTVAILPMIERRSQGLRYLSLAGFYQPLRSFPCVPAQADAAAEALVRALFHEVPGWDVLRFGPLDDAAPERAALLRALSTYARHRISLPRGRTIVNPLETSFEPYAASKSVKRIESYTRKFLREPGAAIRHVRNPDAAAAAALYADLGTVERHSWLAREDGDLRFATDTDRAFWEALTAHSLTPGGQLDVWVASLGERPIAFRFVLTAGTASFMLANQYDEEFAEFRLGWVLYLEHLREAVTHGVRTIDSAPGDIHYKGRLGGEEAQMRTDEVVFRNGARGWALARLLGGVRTLRETLDAKPWGKRFAARLPRV
jgi:CelD/BcsL family acetyltransferase involved in cellulose biosynthesis